MGRRMINWEALQNKAFGLAANGMSLRKISENIGVKYSAFMHWWTMNTTRADYDIFLKENKLTDNRKIIRRVDREEKTELNLPLFQIKSDIFRNTLKVGDKVKNYRYHEEGVVIAKYPYIFTIRNEHGFISSYGYNCFMDFEKKVKE